MFYILFGRYRELPDGEMRALGNRMCLVFGFTIAGMVALYVLVSINKMTNP
ncbi:MAG: hypothetical protein JWN73_1720 [Betaproteobacteria bacterium]|nr:hypothetical protein [Betaproteobacteria bacterium]